MLQIFRQHENMNVLAAAGCCRLWRLWQEAFSVVGAALVLRKSTSISIYSILELKIFLR